MLEPFLRKWKFLNFFLYELPLIFRVAMLGNGQKIKNDFSSSRDFSGKADSIILLGFEYTINPENVVKIVGAIFEKIKILNFFSCELPLILGVGGKLKKRLEIFTCGPYISNLNEIGQLV